MGSEMELHHLNMRVVGLSLGGVAGALSILCGILLVLAPDATVGFFGLLTHYGIAMQAKNVGLVSIIASGVIWFITGGVIGAIFTVFYNSCVDHCK